MKRTFATLALAIVGLTGVNAAAEFHGPVRTRIDASNKTCSEVRHAIRRAGAAIVYESSDIYDKYVSHQGYCALGETAEITWIATADSNQCAVYHCMNRNEGGGSF